MPSGKHGRMYNASRVRYVPVRQGVTTATNSFWMKRMGKLVYSVYLRTTTGWQQARRL